MKRSGRSDSERVYVVQAEVHLQATDIAQAIARAEDVMCCVLKRKIVKAVAVGLARGKEEGEP